MTLDDLKTKTDPELWAIALQDAQAELVNAQRQVRRFQYAARMIRRQIRDNAPWPRLLKPAPAGDRE